MKARFLSAILWVAFVASAAPAHAQDRRDVQVADKVASVISQYVHYTIFDDLGGVVNNGVVTLTGKVTMPFKRSDIEKRVARIDGVRGVQDQIEVLPVSIVDDQIRASVARAIYRNPAFWNYAAMVNPPIHVIVDGGRVTLTGVVSSNVDRMLAQSLATGHGEFAVKNALKTE